MRCADAAGRVGAVAAVAAGDEVDELGSITPSDWDAGSWERKSAVVDRQLKLCSDEADAGGAESVAVSSHCGRCICPSPSSVMKDSCTLLKNCDRGRRVRAGGADCGGSGTGRAVRTSVDRRREKVRRIAPSTSCAAVRIAPEEPTRASRRERATCTSGPASMPPCSAPLLPACASEGCGAGSAALTAAWGTAASTGGGRSGKAAYTNETSAPGAEESEAGDAGVGGCAAVPVTVACVRMRAVLRGWGSAGNAILLSLTTVDVGVSAAYDGVGDASGHGSGMKQSSCADGAVDIGSEGADPVRDVTAATYDTGSRLEAVSVLVGGLTATEIGGGGSATAAAAARLPAAGPITSVSHSATACMEPPAALCTCCPAPVPPATPRGSGAGSPGRPAPPPAGSGRSCSGGRVWPSSLESSGRIPETAVAQRSSPTSLLVAFHPSTSASSSESRAGVAALASLAGPAAAAGRLASPPAPAAGPDAEGARLLLLRVVAARALRSRPCLTASGLALSAGSR